jgi:hypothetical protein
VLATFNIVRASIGGGEGWGGGKKLIMDTICVTGLLVEPASGSIYGS